MHEAAVHGSQDVTAHALIAITKKDAADSAHGQSINRISSQNIGCGILGVEHFGSFMDRTRIGRKSLSSILPNLQFTPYNSSLKTQHRPAIHLRHGAIHQDEAFIRSLRRPDMAHKFSVARHRSLSPRFPRLCKEEGNLLI